jgi:hypothetical protein
MVHLEDLQFASTWFPHPAEVDYTIIPFDLSTGGFKIPLRKNTTRSQVMTKIQRTQELRNADFELRILEDAPRVRNSHFAIRISK